MIFPTPYFICLPFVYKVMALIIIFIGILIGYEFAKLRLSYNLFSLNYLFVSRFLGIMWNMPIISTLGTNYYFVSLGNLYSKLFDQG